MLEDGRNLLPAPRIVARYAEVLRIDDADIIRAFALDRQALDQPIKPYLVERLMPAVYRRHKLSEDCPVDEARKIAARMSVETGRSFCLVLSKVRSVYFYPSGKHCESNYVPDTSIGRYKAFMTQASGKSNGRIR